MYVHKSVLLKEAVELLNIKPSGIYVDATTGGGGHSSLILSKLTTGHLYCFDQDESAFLKAKEKLDSIGQNYTFIPSNFVNLREELAKCGVDHIDGILYDLGVSSFQLDIQERGFSYKLDAPLDMRMNQRQDLSAYTIVNQYSFEDISQLLFRYGEEPFAKAIARKIEEKRKEADSGAKNGPGIFLYYFDRGNSPFHALGGKVRRSHEDCRCPFHLCVYNLCYWFGCGRHLYKI